MGINNQRKIYVEKDNDTSKYLYSKMTLRSLSKAAYYLQTKVGFKLYIYISKNSNHYTFQLSSKDFMEWCNCGRDAYMSAFNELVATGFLVLSDREKNLYTFYDYPDGEDRNQEFIEEVEITFANSNEEEFNVALNKH